MATIINDTTILLNGEEAPITITIPDFEGDVEVKGGMVNVKVASDSRPGLTHKVLMGQKGALGCTCEAGRRRKKCWHLDLATITWDLRQKAARRIQMQLHDIKTACGMSSPRFQREWTLAKRQCGYDRYAAALLLDARWGTGVCPNRHGFRRAA